MIPALKSFLKFLALGYALFFASLLCGALRGEPAFFAIAGLFLALVPLMAGFLQIWDRVLVAAQDCWACGRDQIYGRHMYVAEWYGRGQNDDGLCAHCERNLSQPGDRVYGMRHRGDATSRAKTA